MTAKFSYGMVTLIWIVTRTIKWQSKCFPTNRQFYFLFFSQVLLMLTCQVTSFVPGLPHQASNTVLKCHYLLQSLFQLNQVCYRVHCLGSLLFWVVRYYWFLVDLSQVFWELSPQNVYDKRDFKPVFICVHDCQILINPCLSNSCYLFHRPRSL